MLNRATSSLNWTPYYMLMPGKWCGGVVSVTAMLTDVLDSIAMAGDPFSTWTNTNFIMWNTFCQNTDKKKIEHFVNTLTKKYLFFSVSVLTKCILGSAFVMHIYLMTTTIRQDYQGWSSSVHHSMSLQKKKNLWMSGNKIAHVYRCVHMCVCVYMCVRVYVYICVCMCVCLNSYHFLISQKYIIYWFSFTKTLTGNIKCMHWSHCITTSLIHSLH